MLYPVLKNIRYHGPGEYHRKLISPTDDIARKGLSFDHLSPAEIALLQRRGILGQAIKPTATKTAEKAPEIR